MASMLQRFGAQELEVVRKHWGKITSEEIGKLIRRSSSSVRVAGRKLGLPMLRSARPKESFRKAPNPQNWTDSPLGYFRDLDPPPSEPELERAVDVLERMRTGWMTALEERNRRAANGERCICGRPGLPWCPKHRQLLQREGML